MTAETDLRALLIASSAVTTLVGQRIAVDRIEQGAARPFIVFTRNGTERTKGLDGTVHGVLVTFGVQCWADTRAAAESVAEAVQTALESAYHNVGDRSSAYDSDLDLEASTFTVGWWE
jgi:hypothetical protein